MGQLPVSLVSGDAHHHVEELVEVAASAKKGLQVAPLKALRDAIFPHFDEEEREIMPRMLENFTERELWALDSFIVNPNLDYCPQDVLLRITFWWFANTSLREGWAFFQNLMRSGKQPRMGKDFWATINALVPALQGHSLEDLMP